MAEGDFDYIKLEDKKQEDNNDDNEDWQNFQFIDETSFTGDNFGVTIRKKTNKTNTLPDIPTSTPVYTDITNPKNEVYFAVEDFITKNYKTAFRFNHLKGMAASEGIDFRLNLGKTKSNHITYRPLNAKNNRGNSIIVLKRNNNGILQYNKNTNAKEAVKQFKKEIKRIINLQDEFLKTEESMPMVDLNNQCTENFNQITNEEIREHIGVMEPSGTIDKRTRPQFIEAQINHFAEELNKTIARIDEIENENGIDNNIDELTNLRERAAELEIIIREEEDQLEKEDVRDKQEEDITRLQQFKEWVKENVPGLSALAISIGSIIATIVIGARKAILQGAQATSKFSKALANLGKKLWPVLGPLLNIITQAISWGAKGLAWLASNLWVLAIAAALLIYDQYKQRKK